MIDAVAIPFAVTLLLAFARLAGLMLMAPALGEAVAPARLRVAMALVMALAVAGCHAMPVSVPQTLPALILAVAVEVAIGAAVGYAARLVFAGLELGAFHISQQMGLALAEVFNPFTEEASDVVRRFFMVLAVILFFALGGHRALIGSVLGSFDVLPLGQGVSAQAALTTVVSILAMSFSLALKVAGPVLAAMMLALAAMGLLQRTMPQCNILSATMPIHILLGGAILALSLGAVPGLMESAWTYASRNLASAIDQAGRQP